MTEFRSFISSTLDEAPEHIVFGKVARFGKKKALWAIPFDDGTGGICGDHRTGEKFVWQSGQKKVSRQSIVAANLLAKKARDEDYAKASKHAQEVFEGAKDADANHPYLLSKKVKPHGLKQTGNRLLVPVKSVSGDMQSIQEIDDLGKKKFLTGGKVAGGCHMIGLLVESEPAIICEGYATGASLFEDGCPFVVLAFSAWNLKPVAIDLRKQFPKLKIVIAGDDDWQTEGNPGKTSAIEAASAVGGKCVVPNFGEHRAPEWTDFNDLFTKALHGPI